MSFVLKDWSSRFSDSFKERAVSLLSSTLNKGSTHSMIADRITVKELNMGTIPPDLEILEIGDLASDRFQGLFNLHYAGDAYLVLQTKVQANPLSVKQTPFPGLTSRRDMLAARAPLTVPMYLRLSEIKLNGIVVLVFSRQKGVTMVFRNDPLESLKVSSSFDSIPAIARFLKREIEVQLTSLFQEELPAIIYKLSRYWCAHMESPFSMSSVISRPPSQQRVSRSVPDVIETPPDYNESTKLDTNSPVKIGPLSTTTHPNLLAIASLVTSRRSLAPNASPCIPMAVYRSSNLDTLNSQIVQTEDGALPASQSPTLQFSRLENSNESKFPTPKNASATPAASIFGHSDSSKRRRERKKKHHFVKVFNRASGEKHKEKETKQDVIESADIKISTPANELSKIKDKIISKQGQEQFAKSLSRKAALDLAMFSHRDCAPFAIKLNGLQWYIHSKVML
ncbi:outer membrane protein Mdm34 [Schizosaccharomyces japonicus yFS275]|uniref:Mitochondrial distribution and morphology protein 34 n=1 Tax=Schizosaccharomyces japonicus (strain yFS275 / FY16936) TaxID=402676 RepID=B6K0B1_SCHJY|nr:outer membrane protein Mdm34 [Schizosaccharomyces japonicus yFS275]EEB06261.1 outer membrane protein Mdm34 [Schizosaccharomyces japonicus yFS275]